MIIDVSKHNGDIDFAKVKGNVEAIVIRLGYRGYGTGVIAQDPKFAANLKGCQDNGIPYSVYFFPCSIDDAEAIEEGNFIVNAVKNMNISLPVFLDSEVSAPGKTGRSDNLSKEQRTHLLRVIIDVVKTAGIQIGVYASTSWLNNQLDMSKLSDVPVWVAQYNTHCTYGGTYQMWQYTSDGAVDGVPGRVDCSKNISFEVKSALNIPTSTVSVDQAAQMIRTGQIGVGHEVRRAWCEAHGLNYEVVRVRVNELAGVSNKPSLPTYIIGKSYTTIVDGIIVRQAPGKNSVKTGYAALTADGKKHDRDRNGSLDKGTTVTCKGVTTVGNDVWIKTPSGWIAAYYQGEHFVK